MIEHDDVLRAAARLDGIAHRTPVATSTILDERTGATVLCKCENLQRIGAFKFRGAYNTVAQLDSPRGLITASSGNHAQAVALSAALRDLPATVMMPHDAPASKAAATAGYGAEIVRFDRYRDDRETLLATLARQRGLTIVHPYDDDRIMAGQGTATLELIEQAGVLDLLFVPVGGGGLIAGAATVARAIAPGCRVIGVEPAAGDDTARSLAAGERVRIPVARTIADGQQVETPGERTFAVVRERVDAVVTVSDAEIIDAMRFAFERLKLVVEPSGASALAALLAGRVEASGARAGVILSGGNVDTERFNQLLS